MKKLVALLLLLCTFALFFTSCTGKSAIAKPEDTNLEYWLFDEPDEDNLTLLQSDGSYKRYLAAGYEHIDGNPGCVPNCLYYETSKTLIGLTNSNRIRKIIITSPEVIVWGLTVNSTHEEFYKTLTQIGFKETYRSEEFGYSTYKFIDNKRIYTIDIGYANNGSSIQIYCTDRDYVNEFLAEIGFYEALTDLYIWLETEVFK